MKKTINAAIGGCSFTINEDAYACLDNYLERFKAAVADGNQSAAVLDQLEARIADQLKFKLGSREVVDLKMAEAVIGDLGYTELPESKKNEAPKHEEPRSAKKLFRDPDGKSIAGVCSGLALYFDIDVVLIRVIFLVALICGTAGFWIYVAIWIVAPMANTAAEKCELRGIPATAENIRRFSQGKSS